jgi:hypothetical protein
MRSERAFEAKRVCCAVSRCMTVVEPGQMMCLNHWSLVPRTLQIEIGHTYRARQMRNYQDAYRRAVDHVESALGIFAGIFDKPVKREAAAPARPAKPIGLRVRRPRLTIKRLAAIEEALKIAAQQDGDHSGALLWVRGEQAKRRVRKAVRT